MWLCVCVCVRACVCAVCACAHARAFAFACACVYACLHWGSYRLSGALAAERCRVVGVEGAEERERDAGRRDGRKEPHALEGHADRGVARLGALEYEFDLVVEGGVARSGASLQTWFNLEKLPHFYRRPCRPCRLARAQWGFESETNGDGRTPSDLAEATRAPVPLRAGLPGTP